MYSTLNEHLHHLPKALRDVFIDADLFYPITTVKVNVLGETLQTNPIEGIYVGPPSFDKPTVEDWWRTYDKFVENIIATIKYLPPLTLPEMLVDRFQITFDQEFSRTGNRLEISIQLHVINAEKE